MKTLILFSSALLCLNTLVAQTTVTKINNNTNKLDSTINSVNHASTTINNTSDAVKGLAQTFGSILGGKHKKNKPVETISALPANAITISITGIDYSKLELTQDSIQIINGVQSVDFNYNAAGSAMQVLYAGKASQLWRVMPVSIKEMFKVNSVDSNTISVDFINKK